MENNSVKSAFITGIFAVVAACIAGGFLLLNTAFDKGLVGIDPSPQAGYANDQPATTNEPTPLVTAGSPTTGNATAVTGRPVATIAAPASSLACKSWSDDFSTTSGWGDENAGWAEWGHVQDEYHMTVNQASSLLKRCATCRDTIGNLRLSVVARRIKGDGTWGIYFYDQDEKWYSFELDTDGHAAIKKYHGFNDQVALAEIPIPVQTSVRLTVERIDRAISAYLDDVQVANIPYEALTSGNTSGIGLIVTTRSSFPFEVAFDDFVFSGCP